MRTDKQIGQPVQGVRQRLLTAAEELFYAHGIASVGVDAVVGRAGVAIASLYKHFGGKDGLVAAYLEARDQRWRQHWEAHIERENDPLHRAMAIFVALETWKVDQHFDKGCAHLAALQQLAEDHPGAAAARNHKHYVRRRLRELLTAADCPEPVQASIDLLLIYEGTLALQATGHVHDAVGRGHHLAQRHLERTIRQRG